ncbi:MAG: transporter substrate-binding domain-containing protein, partial [Acidobacteria bacterium]|nr:transporter substrate-binding domain-containing protein [Acidobacteriota bacterium]
MERSVQRLSLLALLATLAGVCAVAADAPPLRIGFQESPPVQFVTPDGRPTGPIIELIGAAAARRGIRLEWVHRPDGPDKAMADGSVDLWPLTAMLDSRRRAMTFSDPYLRVRFWILARPGSGISTLADLPGRKVAHVRGALYSSILQRVVPSFQSLPEANQFSALRALCEAQADAALMVQGTGEATAGRTDVCSTAGYRVIPIPGAAVQFSVAARRDNRRAAQAADAIVEEIVQLFDEGELAGIWMKWGLSSIESRMLADYLSARRESNRAALVAAALAFAFLGALWLAFRWRAAQRAARDATRAKSYFLASMSHEIRTPMNGVLGVSSLLAATPLNEEQQGYVSLIEHSASSLLRILNDVLDVARAESGSLHLSLAPFDLRELGRECLLLLTPQAESKGLAARFEWDESMPLLWHGDSTRLRQILNNLISNAVKYTPAGEVRLRIEAAAGGVSLRVRDTGPGLPPELCSGGFEKFARGKAHENAGIEGTGLGLFICAMLTKLMDGRMEVETSPASGTEFRIFLPLQPATEAAAAAERPSSIALPALPASQPSAHRILLVEDNKINQVV